jgi:hypothetical protein
MDSLPVYLLHMLCILDGMRPKLAPTSHDTDHT